MDDWLTEERNESEILALHVNWATATDAELGRDLGIWRPEKIRGPRQSKRGKNNPVHHWGRLNHLAVLRLQHHYEFTEAYGKATDRDKQLNISDEKVFRNGSSRARKDFAAFYGAVEKVPQSSLSWKKIQKITA